MSICMRWMSVLVMICALSACGGLSGQLHEVEVMWCAGLKGEEREECLSELAGLLSRYEVTDLTFAHPFAFAKQCDSPNDDDYDYDWCDEHSVYCRVTAFIGTDDEHCADLDQQPDMDADLN